MMTERFAAMFQRIVGASGVTPYMHVVLNHVCEIVRVFHVVIKGCSRGAEALHQRIKKKRRPQIGMTILSAHKFGQGK
jgi:hypothetical protein